MMGCLRIKIVLRGDVALAACSVTREGGGNSDDSDEEDELLG